MNEWVHFTWFYRQRPEDDVQSNLHVIWNLYRTPTCKYQFNIEFQKINLMHLIFGFDHQSIHVHVLCFGQIKMGGKKMNKQQFKKI